MKSKYIQVGETALRDPVTGEFLPSVPLYVQAEGGAEEAEKGLIDDIGALLAHKMKAYRDGCRKAGVMV